MVKRVRRKQGTRQGLGDWNDPRLTFSCSLDIMSLTASLLDQAHHKLARWCSFEFRQMGKDAHLDVGPVMQKAVQRLRQQPELLRSVASLD